MPASPDICIPNQETIHTMSHSPSWIPTRNHPRCSVPLVAVVLLAFTVRPSQSEPPTPAPTPAPTPMQAPETRFTQNGYTFDRIATSARAAVADDHVVALLMNDGSVARWDPTGLVPLPPKLRMTSIYADSGQTWIRTAGHPGTSSADMGYYHRFDFDRWREVGGRGHRNSHLFVPVRSFAYLLSWQSGTYFFSISDASLETAHSFPDREKVHGLVVNRNRHVFVWHRQGTLSLWDPDRSAFDPIGEHEAIKQISAHDGTLYVLRHEPPLLTYDVATTRWGTIDVPGAIHSLHPDETGLYALHQDSSIHRYHGGVWSLILDGNLLRTISVANGTLAILRSDDSVFVTQVPASLRDAGHVENFQASFGFVK